MPESESESSELSSGHGTPGKRSGSPERNASGLQRKFIDVLAWLITGAWATSFIVDMTPYPYDPPPTIHALMLIVVGAAFGTSLIKRGE